MYFPISDAHISPIYLGLVGFLIGVLGGFFGVGGSFIAGPALRAVGLPWNFAVGTDLAHIVGKSVVAARRHRALGNVDMRLGLIMAGGTIVGAEVGAQLIQMLKRAGNVNLVVSAVSIVVYFGISAFMIWEGWRTLALEGTKAGKRPALRRRQDHSAFSHIALKLQKLHLPPMIELPASGIKGISLWIFCWSHSSGVCSAASSAVARATSECPPWFMCWGFQRISPSAPTFLKSLFPRAMGPLATRSKATSTSSSHSLCTRGLRSVPKSAPLDPVFRWPENPPRFRATAADWRSHCHLHLSEWSQVVTAYAYSYL